MSNTFLLHDIHRRLRPNQEPSKLSQIRFIRSDINSRERQSSDVHAVKKNDNYIVNPKGKRNGIGGMSIHRCDYPHIHPKGFEHDVNQDWNDKSTYVISDYSSVKKARYFCYKISSSHELTNEEKEHYDIHMDKKSDEQTHKNAIHGVIYPQKTITLCNSHQQNDRWLGSFPFINGINWERCCILIDSNMKASALFLDFETFPDEKCYFILLALMNLKDIIGTAEGECEISSLISHINENIDFNLILNLSLMELHLIEDALIEYQIICNVDDVDYIHAIILDITKKIDSLQNYSNSK